MTKEFGIFVILAMMGIAIKETIFAKELSFKGIWYHLALFAMAYVAVRIEGPVQSEFTSVPRTMLAAGTVSSVTYFFSYFLAAMNRKSRQSEPAREVREEPRYSPPPPTPQTIIHYTDNRDQSIRIDNSVRVRVGALTPDDARELLQLSERFSPRQLNKAYDARRKDLEKQVARLPRGDLDNRRLLTHEQHQVDEAYQLLTHEK